MGKIRFSLMQIEAFACVCEAGNFTQAAKRLKKDRTTISELIEYLEIDLGYSLFERQTRPLQLTAMGQQLYRQARLFLQEAEAFCLLAEQIPQNASQHLTLCYDPFIPRQLLTKLACELQKHNIQLNFLMMEREEAEIALEKNRADIAVYQAVNQSISEKFKWRAIGAIEFAVYASDHFFPDVSPISLLSLASERQIIPFTHFPDPISKRLQISDNIQVVNELPLLLSLVEAAHGWAFLPTHLSLTSWPKITRQHTELGLQGLFHPIVALWKPGPSRHVLNTVEQLQRLYGKD